MALPVIFQPVVVGGRALIDGGLTNPLPFDLLMSEADVVVAIDVSGAPVPDPRRATPTAFEALFASAFLFERTIVKEKLKAAQPDILISAGTSQYQVLDFLKFDEILAAAEPAKERLKQQLVARAVGRDAPRSDGTRAAIRTRSSRQSRRGAACSPAPARPASTSRPAASSTPANCDSPPLRGGVRGGVKQKD